jgi:hypothetical protein
VFFVAYLGGYFAGHAATVALWAARAADTAAPRADCAVCLAVLYAARAACFAAFFAAASVPDAAAVRAALRVATALASAEAYVWRAVLIAALRVVRASATHCMCVETFAAGVPAGTVAEVVVAANAGTANASAMIAGATAVAKEYLVIEK